MKKLSKRISSIKLSKTLEKSHLTKIRGGSTDDLWEWRKNIEDGKIDRRTEGNV